MLSGFEAVRKEAMGTMPQIVQSELEKDGDRQNFIVIARDESGMPVYTASLAYIGLRLTDKLSG